MAQKNNPLLDGLAVGMAVNAIADKDDPKSSEKAFAAAAVTWTRSSLNNKEAEKEARKHRYLESQNREQLDAVHSKNQVLRAENMRLQNQQVQATHNAETTREQIAAVRKFIVEAESTLEDLEHCDRPDLELASLWLVLKLIDRNADQSSIALDELRAIQSIRKALVLRSRELDIQPSRIIATVHGLIASVASWGVFQSQDLQEISLRKMPGYRNRYLRCRKYGARYQLITSADSDKPIRLLPDAVKLFDTVGQVLLLEMLFTGGNIDGAQPFDHEEIQQRIDQYKRQIAQRKRRDQKQLEQYHAISKKNEVASQPVSMPKDSSMLGKRFAISLLVVTSCACFFMAEGFELFGAGFADTNVGISINIILFFVAVGAMGASVGYGLGLAFHLLGAFLPKSVIRLIQG